MRKYTLSDSQLQALRNLAAGRPIGDHLKGRARFGFNRTVMSLVNRQYITADRKITDHGRRALAGAINLQALEETINKVCEVD